MCTVWTLSLWMAAADPTWVTAKMTVAPPDHEGIHWVQTQFIVKPGWHIYWLNPGDSGKATRVKITPPEKGTVGETEYAVPEVFVGAEGAQTYGYTGEHGRLYTPVKLPRGFKGVLHAHADWLVCSKEECIPGEAELTADANRLDPYSVVLRGAVVPVAPDISPRVTNVDSRVELTVPGACREASKVEFIPVLPAGWLVRSVERRANDCVVTLGLPARPTDTMLTGVLKVPGHRALSVKALFRPAHAMPGTAR